MPNTNPYDVNQFQTQLQNLSRQYQQLSMPQPYYPPLQPQQIQVPVPVHQVQYVEGLQGAKLYQDGMQPNSSEIIMDKNEDVFYHVSKDANGTPAKTIPKGHFTIETTVEEEPVFLTRKDLDSFKEEIREMLQKSTQKSSKS